MEKRPLNQLQEKKSLSCTTLVRSISLSSFFFSEPFDAASWMLVGLAAVQISAFSIFLFEWLSPAGYDMKVRIKGGFPAYFSTLIKFPRNNKKFFNFMTTSILPFFCNKESQVLLLHNWPLFLTSRSHQSYEMHFVNGPHSPIFP